MPIIGRVESDYRGENVVDPAVAATVFPQAFDASFLSDAARTYLADPSTARLAEFFIAKGLAALKNEDQREEWYDDWLKYQAEHRLYASVLSPGELSSIGAEFDLLRYTRFLEVFAYFSPAHGYSIQVTFLGLFVILMGSNAALKKEAIESLEHGGVLALGVSEKHHGSDLLASEFVIRETGHGTYVANGSKYYIGNANVASIISILAKKEDGNGNGNGTGKRDPFVCFALRPPSSTGFTGARKIRTLGVRAGYVGEFDVKDHAFPQADVIAEGRQAWDAVFGTVTLGKFFLGFGSIGICEHAFHEAANHLRSRILYGKPVLEMPHIRSAMAQAFTRLTAMKLYAYRVLDYVQAASARDRRYVLFCAVQKARVSTEAVKVIALLAECCGAKASESQTYLEMALRDAALIPSVEGSTHINLGLAARFIPKYLGSPDSTMPNPPSLVAADEPPRENTYLMHARTGGLNGIKFRQFLAAYEPLASVANVKSFARQAKAFRLFLVIRGGRLRLNSVADTETALMLGQCLSTIAFGQLIAENCVLLQAEAPMTAAIFHLLIEDLSELALRLASSSKIDAIGRVLLRRIVTIPTTTTQDWDVVVQMMSSNTTGALGKPAIGAWKADRDGPSAPASDNGKPVPR